MSSSAPKASATRASDENVRAQFEEGMVSVFAELADLFGNPRSHGQIYGLLFSSPEPLAMEEIAKRIGISLGSASLGLRTLENLGVIERNNGARVALYTARLELKNLINGFIRNRLIPRLEKSNTTLANLAGVIPGMRPEEAKEAAFRLQRVTQWHTRAARFLPLAEKILQSASKFTSQGDRE